MSKTIGMILPGGFSDVHEVFRELVLGSDRAAAVVGGALVDEILERVLREFVRQDDKSVDDIFGNNSPLGTFSAKINMGYYLCLYGVEIKKDLHLIRKVRNQFAHQLNATFATQSIKDSVANLQLVERYSSDINEPVYRLGVGSMPENRMDWPSWIFLHDRLQVLANPRERFIGELQALAWALSCAYGARVSVGNLG